ncbi:MAG: hypothetical protein M3Q30_23955 [Actinomycetota bacterium]|nr:hypothetical protein [Actinomycetota bacterium]
MTGQPMNAPIGEYDAWNVGDKDEQDLCSFCANSSPMTIAPRHDESQPLPTHAEACTRCGVRYRQSVKQR